MMNGLTCVALAFLGAAIGSLATRAAQPPGEIRATSLALVDAEGTTQYTIKLARELGPVHRLAIADSKGRERVKLEVRDGETDFTLLDAAGKTRYMTILHDESDQVGTYLFDHDGVGLAYMAVAGTKGDAGGNVMVSSRKGKYVESFPASLTGK